MKRTSTLILLLCLFLSVSAQKKKIGYFSFQKTMDATAATVNNDPILKMLQADPNLDVTANIMTDNTTAATADFSPYDAVVIMESFGGGDQILMPAGALALSKLTKPTLYNKCFAFKAGRNLPTGSTGTGSETVGSATLKFVYLNVDASHKSHDLFKDITFTGDSVALFIQGATDVGATGSGYKAINYATSVYISNPNTLLARPNTVKASDLPNLTLSFNDLPAGTVIGGTANQSVAGITLQNRVITVGMNFGAICATNGTNITDAGLKIFKNAVYSLSGIGAIVSVSQITVTGNNNATSITTNGGTLQMNAAVAPNNATDKSVVWSVSDESVATISSTGVLTAVKNGTVTVTATSVSTPAVKGTIQIAITGQIAPVTAITVTGVNNATSISTNAGTLQMNATIVPTDATDKTVIWSVSDATVATISTSGLLTAVKNGTTVVTATSNSNPNVSGSLQITVSGQVVPVTGIKVSAINNVTSVAIGSSLQMNVTVLPADATDKSVTWSVNDATIASISTTGLLTPLKSGVVTVKAVSSVNAAILGVTQIAVTRSVGINDIDLEQIVVSPNPATDVLYISNAASLKEIEILNNQGQLIKTVTNGGDQAQIEINDLKPGVYILRSGKFVKRFVKK